MSNGQGGAEGGGAAIVSAVGTAGGTASTATRDMSATPPSRIVSTPTVTRLVTVRRMSEG